MKKSKENKGYLITKRILIVFTILGIIIFGALIAFNFSLDSEKTVTADGTVVDNSSKKTVINALVCGKNDNLTDTIIYVKYDVEKGDINMMSIPRDTYVTNEYCIGHKINAIYRGENIVPLVEEIQDKLDVKIDYYLVFDANMLKKMVDALGGVEIDVPINMKYDDKTQNLHINLKKGLQTLNGDQAEQFVRFRHNNDGTGYVMGDLDRTKAQQTFIKTFINKVLDAKNISKIPELINIAMEDTDTNITLREALKYVTDASKIKKDTLNAVTAPGEAKYIDSLSYFLLDEEEAQRVVKEDFTNVITEQTTDTNTETTETKSN